MQTVWTDKMSVLIWIQIICCSDSVPERFFFKKLIFEKNQQTTKAWKITQQDGQNSMIFFQIFFFDFPQNDDLWDYWHGSQTAHLLSPVCYLPFQMKKFLKTRFSYSLSNNMACRVPIRIVSKRLFQWAATSHVLGKIEKIFLINRYAYRLLQHNGTTNCRHLIKILPRTRGSRFDVVFPRLTVNILLVSSRKKENNTIGNLIRVADQELSESRTI